MPSPTNDDEPTDSRNITPETKLRLLDLARVINGLLDCHDDESSRKVLFFIRRSLKQFNLLSFYSESDILIEVYLRSHLKIINGHVIDNLPGWIHQVAFNIIREYSRARIKGNKLVQKNTAEYETIADERRTRHVSGQLDSPDFIDPVTVQHLVEALQQLTDFDREILTLRVVKGLSWRQVKVQLKIGDPGFISEATLRQKGKRALARLRHVFYSQAKM